MLVVGGQRIRIRSTEGVKERRVECPFAGAGRHRMRRMWSVIARPAAPPSQLPPN